VTSASDLTVGSNYVVASVSSGSGYGMTGATKSTYYMGAGAVTVTSSTISDISAVAAYTLGGSSGAYTLKNGSNYLRGYVSALTTMLALPLRRETIPPGRFRLLLTERRLSNRPPGPIFHLNPQRVIPNLPVRLLPRPFISSKRFQPLPLRLRA
jgi:hypothetical protein